MIFITILILPNIHYAFAELGIFLPGFMKLRLWEGFCNAVLEAQAMGLLCIVTDADGLSENVLDGKTGWVVPKRSPEELSKKIINILTMDDDRLNQIRKYAAKRVINEFNLEFQSQLFRDFYY